MTDKKSSLTVIRFLLDMQAEEVTYVDLTFENTKQAKRAMQDVFASNGAAVLLITHQEIPVLIRASHVIAAFPYEPDESGKGS